MLATLNQAKGMLGIDSDDTSQDADITIALKAASAAIEKATNRSYGYKTYNQTIDGPGMQFLRLRNFPVHDVIHITVDNEPIPKEQFRIESENGMLFKRSGWPCGVRNVDVEYLAGYALPGDENSPEAPKLPENYTLACIMYAQILLRNPDVSSERVGDISVSYRDNISGLPPVVKALIEL